MRERQQPPDAVHLAGWLFRIKFEKGKTAGYVMFFFSPWAVGAVPIGVM